MIFLFWRFYLIVSMLFFTSCEPLKNTMGFDHKGPDEFDVVPLAPLSLPKDYKKTPIGEQKTSKEEPLQSKEGSSSVVETTEEDTPSISKGESAFTPSTISVPSKADKASHNFEIANSTIGTIAHESFEATDILIGTKPIQSPKLDSSAVKLILEGPEEKVQKIEEPPVRSQMKWETPSIPKEETTPKSTEATPSVQTPIFAPLKQDANDIQIVVDASSEPQEKFQEEPKKTPQEKLVPQKKSSVRTQSISVLEKAPTPILGPLNSEEISGRGEEASYEIIDPVESEKPGKHRWVSVQADPILPPQDFYILDTTDLLVEAPIKPQASVSSQVAIPIPSKNPPLVQTQPQAKKAAPLYRVRKHPRKKLKKPRRWIVKKKIIAKKFRQKSHHAPTNHRRRHGKKR